MTSARGTRGNLPELELANDPGIASAQSLCWLTDGRLRHRRHRSSRRADHTLSFFGSGPVRPRLATT